MKKLKSIFKLKNSEKKTHKKKNDSKTRRRATIYIWKLVVIIAVIFIVGFATVAIVSIKGYEYSNSSWTE